MSDPTDIEKKNLEAHVELCAERYRFLESKLAAVESKISSLAPVISEVRNMVHALAQKRNDQLIGWGVAIIGSLVALVVWFASHYVRM